MYALKKDVQEFIRRISLKEYFYTVEDVAGDFSEATVFKNKSSWCPDKNRELALETYLQELEKRILESDFNARSYAPVNRNLSREEQQTLENLREYDDIVIKKADNGLGVAIMDKDRYIAEGMRQLKDRQVYIPVSEDPTEEMRLKVTAAVTKLGKIGWFY